VSELGRSVPAVFEQAVLPAGIVHVVLQPLWPALRPAILRNAVVLARKTLCCVVSEELEYVLAFATPNASELEVFSSVVQFLFRYCLRTACQSEALDTGSFG
jgi:hypothetical protein